MHRIRLSRRGTSEIIAVMLLIVITVTASIMMYVYVSGLMGRLQGIATRQPYIERVALEYYDWTNPSTLKLTLRNVGAATVVMSDFFINGVSQSQSGCTGNLAPQSGVCTATITPAGPILPIQMGTTYIVKIVTNDGAVFSYSCVPGQTS